MKTLLITFAFVAIFFSANAGENQFGYVVTNHDTLYCQKVDAAALNLKCVLQSGEKVKIAYSNVQLYFDGQQTMVRLPVYLQGKKSGKSALMELVGCENGINIYKYEYYNGSKDCQDAIFSFYVKNEYLSSQTNPDLNQIHNFISGWKTNNQSGSVTNILSEN